MISTAKMLDKVRAKMEKDRRTIRKLKGALEVSRCHTRRVMDRLKAMRGRNAELERAERKRAREARKAQMRLPL